MKSVVSKAATWLDRAWIWLASTLRPPLTEAATWMLRIASPTWWLADRLKGEREGAARTKIIWRLNRIYITAAATVFAFVLATVPLATLQAKTVWSWQAMPAVLWSWRSLAAWALASRCIEVFVAFYRDAGAKLVDPDDGASDLSPAQRVRLALASYVGVILDSALLYGLCPAAMWKCRQGPHQLTDLLSYSATTITTSGGGDLQASHWVLRMLTLGEIFTGVILLVVCFGVYAGQAKR